VPIHNNNNLPRLVNVVLFIYSNPKFTLEFLARNKYRKNRNKLLGVINRHPRPFRIKDLRKAKSILAILTANPGIIHDLELTWKYEEFLLEQKQKEEIALKSFYETLHERSLELQSRSPSSVSSSPLSNRRY